MKAFRLMIPIAAIMMLGITACHGWWLGTVNGNGNIITESRSASGYSKISFGGPFDAVITPGEDYKLSIEADENLMQYIEVDRDGNRLKLRIRNGVNLRSKHGIKVAVSMPKVEGISFAGSGKVKVNGTIMDIEKLNLNVAGSGDIEVAAKCPEVDANIAGSGTIVVSGETRNVKIDIAGSGDFKAAELLSENTDISIAGSGGAWVFASTALNIKIAGSGDVYYKGNPSDIKKKVAGSGNIRPMD